MRIHLIRIKKTNFKFSELGSDWSNSDCSVIRTLRHRIKIIMMCKKCKVKPKRED